MNLFGRDKKLQLYFPKAFHHAKRHSVDISKQLMARDTLKYDAQTKAVTIRNPRRSLPQTQRPPSLDPQSCSDKKRLSVQRMRVLQNMQRLPVDLQTKIQLKYQEQDPKKLKELLLKKQIRAWTQQTDMDATVLENMMA